MLQFLDVVFAASDQTPAGQPQARAGVRATSLQTDLHTGLINQCSSVKPQRTMALLKASFPMVNVRGPPPTHHSPAQSEAFQSGLGGKMKQPETAESSPDAIKRAMLS